MKGVQTIVKPEALLEIAREAAWEAAEVHRRNLGRVEVQHWSEKGVADFVTDVDRQAEERIIDGIRSRCPDHAILAEERENDDEAIADAEWLWIIDPLDGTTNYLHQYPMYTASVAVAHRGEPVAGVVVQPATDEEWTGLRGGGAFKDGEPIRVSEIDDLSRALIGTGFPFKAVDLLPRYMRQFEAVLRRTSGVRRGGSAALDLCHLATGYFDGFWELHLAPWDVAAGTLIAREAGGVVTTLDGDPDVLTPGSVLAGNPVLYEMLADLVQEEA